MSSSVTATSTVTGWIASSCISRCSSVKGLLDVWSDIRIEVGAGWEQEIESAERCPGGGTAGVAGLPGLDLRLGAGDATYRGSSKGRDAAAAPIVVRPCAWRLQAELARLAGPAGGRTCLVDGADPQIDLDLRVYELAGIVGVLPNALAAEERERMTSRSVVSLRRRPASSDRTHHTTRPSLLASETLAPTWRGRYPGDQPRDDAAAGSNVGAEFTGVIEYDHGGMTTVAGTLHSDARGVEGRSRMECTQRLERFRGHVSRAPRHTGRAPADEPRRRVSSVRRRGTDVRGVVLRRSTARHIFLRGRTGPGDRRVKSDAGCILFLA